MLGALSWLGGKGLGNSDPFNQSFYMHELLQLTDLKRDQETSIGLANAQLYFVTHWDKL